jgi:hypothetical protein
MMFRKNGDFCLWHADVVKRIDPVDLKVELKNLIDDTRQRGEFDVKIGDNTPRLTRKLTSKLTCHNRCSIM